MTTKKLTILFAPLDAWGHINCSRGLAEVLQDRGHRIVFAIDKAFKDKLTPFGFEEQLHGLPEDGEEEYWISFMEQTCCYLLEDTLTIAEKFSLPGSLKMFTDLKERNQQYRDIIDRVKPDIIIIDNYICSPALTNSGIPWVWLISVAPQQAFNDNRIPPFYSGLPISGDREEWKRFRNKWFEIFSQFQEEINEYCVSKGAPKLEDSRLHPLSPYLNIYLYPKELDYEELKPLANNWIRVENFIRSTTESFEIPECLRERPGKLIFLSMGSFGCANVGLMTRLTTILAKSLHKFIVSKGPLFESHELPDNMWGQRFLPQIAVLPVVDLVITHGGNNTVTETFYFGKPMLVLPLFDDQYDNGQRIQETGFGLRLNPFHCTENELLIAVDRLVSDHSLAERMTAIGQRIRKSNDKTIVAKLLESIVE